MLVASKINVVSGRLLEVLHTTYPPSVPPIGRTQIRSSHMQIRERPQANDRPPAEEMKPRSSGIECDGQSTSRSSKPHVVKSTSRQYVVVKENKLKETHLPTRPNPALGLDAAYIKKTRLSRSALLLLLQ